MFPFFKKSFMPEFSARIQANCNKSLTKEANDNYLRDKVASCQKLCPVECDGFSLSISSFYFRLPDGKFGPNYAELNVFYETFEYTVISQTPKSSCDAVLGTIGGLVGLFLGASVLSFGEIIEFLFNVVEIVYNSRRVTVVRCRSANVLQIVNVNVNEKMGKCKRGQFYKIRPSIVTQIQRLGILSSRNNGIIRLEQLELDL